jgi:tRNA-binding EMAP/Myf-like protein
MIFLSCFVLKENVVTALASYHKLLKLNIDVAQAICGLNKNNRTAFGKKFKPVLLIVTLKLTPAKMNIFPSKF